MCVKSPLALTELTSVCTFQTWVSRSFMGALQTPVHGITWGLMPMAMTRLTSISYSVIPRQCLVEGIVLVSLLSRGFIHF